MVVVNFFGGTWGFLLVNCYLCYVRYNLLHGRKKTELLTHYEFRKSIALAWIDPKTYCTDKDNNGSVSVVTTTSSSKKRNRSDDDNFRQTRRQLLVVEKQKHRSAVVTDAALDPMNGSLRSRLILNLGH